MCNEKILELLSCHLDGCNTPEQEATLQAHLSECPDCRNLLAQYKKMDDGLAAAPCRVPPDFTAGVMNAIRQDAPPKAKPHKGLPFRYGTAVAAVAAVFLILISNGRLGDLLGGAVSLSAPKSMPETADAMPEAAADADAPQEKTLLTAPLPDAAPLPANVDCQALAQAEGCLVGVLYEQPEKLDELSDAAYLTLSGGRQYSLTQALLLSLADRYPSLQLFYPDPAPDDAAANAYLIVVTSAE